MKFWEVIEGMSSARKASAALMLTGVDTARENPLDALDGLTDAKADLQKLTAAGRASYAEIRKITMEHSYCAGAVFARKAVHQTRAARWAGVATRDHQAVSSGGVLRSQLPLVSTGEIDEFNLNNHQRG